MKMKQICQHTAQHLCPDNHGKTKAWLHIDYFQGSDKSSQHPSNDWRGHHEWQKHWRWEKREICSLINSKYRHRFDVKQQSIFGAKTDWKLRNWAVFGKSVNTVSMFNYGNFPNRIGFLYFRGYPSQLLEFTSSQFILKTNSSAIWSELQN